MLVNRFRESKHRNARLYAHASGLVGAASLLNVFKDIVEWRSFVMGFILWWQTHVRPIVQYFFWWLAELWPWHWPDWGYDYVVISFLIGFGGVRFFELFFPLRDTDGFKSLAVWSGGDVGPSQRLNVVSWGSIRRLLLLFVVTFALWPLFLLGLFIFSILTWLNDGFSGPIREALFLALSPFIYFMLALILNYALLFAGVK